MKKCPYIIGNIAASLDGKIAPYDRKRINISCQDDFYLRELLRSCVDGILIGGKTLCNDNPSLLLKDPKLIYLREKEGLSTQPASIALCGKNEPDINSKFVAEVRTRRIIIAGKNFEHNYSQVEIYKLETQQPKLDEALELMYDLGFRTVLVEGGGTLFFTLMAENYMKEFLISYHPIIIGGTEAPSIFDGVGFDQTKIRKVQIQNKKTLEDGGMTIHCITGQMESKIEKDYKFRRVKEWIQ